MIIRIIAILLITFTPINNIPCEEDANCECSSLNPGELFITCDIYNSTAYTVNIQSRHNVQIICKKVISPDQFYIKGNNLTENILKSLSFGHCGLSDGVSLKDVVKQIGVKDSGILNFQSFQNLNASLKREHLQGFPSVKTLILSNNGLTNIPKDLFVDFPKLEYIDLSNNDIKLPVGIFDANPNLKNIIFEQSGIEVIDDGTFNKLENVEYLNLMSNKLKNIKRNTFDQLVSLRMLELKNSQITALPPTVFYALKKLVHLDISMNYFSFIPSNLFSQNKELRELLLQKNINNMSTLPDYLLADLTQLIRVKLSRNGFTYLPKNLFRGSLSLEDIFLNNNYLVTLPMNIFRGLKNCKKLILKNNKIESLPDKIFADMEKLSLLDLSNNRIFRLSSDIFYGLVSLVELNMERNLLRHMDEKSLYPLKKLKVAKFSHIPLSLPYYEHKLSFFYANQNLRSLYLSNCSIFTFFSDWTVGNNNLRLLDLSHNFITNLTESLFILPVDEITIDLSYNKISNIHLHQIEELVSFHKAKNKVNLILKHNPLLCDCPLYDLLRYQEGKMAKSVYNYFNITVTGLTCVPLDETIDLEVSNLNSSTFECVEHDYFQTINRCISNCICKVRPSEKTRIIDCSYKKMSKFLIEDRRLFTFKEISFILNLTGNFLTEIPSKELLFPLNVTSLLLSNNIISTITLDTLPNTLKVLELHNNNISYVHSDVTMYLYSLNLEKFTLSGNPIICDCHNQDLLNFIQSHQDYYGDLNNLTCKDTHLPINQITVYTLCPSHLITIVIISVLLIVMVTGGTFLFYYRNNILSWFINDPTQFNVYFSRRNEPEN